MSILLNLVKCCYILLNLIKVSHVCVGVDDETDDINDASVQNESSYFNHNAATATNKVHPASRLVLTSQLL